MKKTKASVVQAAATDIVIYEDGKHSMLMADGRQAVARLCDRLWKEHKSGKMELYCALVKNGKRRAGRK